MKALTWHGRRDVRVDTVPDPTIEQPTDAIIRVTSSGLCGSDLHLYEVLGPFLEQGDVLGHEPMGIVEEVGLEAAKHLSVGDRVVVPFNISCGHCFMCEQGLQTQCETTQVRDEGMGAALFGYTKLYGQVPGGQAEFLRIPQAHYRPIKVPEGPPDDRYLFLSDVLPTAWQAVEDAQHPRGWQRRGDRARADRRDVLSHRPAAWRRDGDRPRSRARAPRTRGGAWCANRCRRRHR
jgi:threonine dehydrogenase-like Zn-dependent dehydrogenase